MKERKEVAEYINSGKCREDTEEKYSVTCWHFGKCELHCILDFIYGGEPGDDEMITSLDGE